MRTRLTLRPGQKGTRRLCEKYGDQLVCVRYRYDAPRKARLKTVELIVEERPWVYCRPFCPLPADRKVLVAIQYGERDLGRALRQAGGRWRTEHVAWEVPFAVVERLGIQGLVVLERAAKPKAEGRWREKHREPREHLPVDAK